MERWEEGQTEAEAKWRGCQCGSMNSFPLSPVSGGPRLNPLHWLQGDSERPCNGFWPVELSGCLSVLITRRTGSVRYGDAIGQKR